MVNIYIDDLRVIPKGFIGARNYWSAINLIEKYKGEINIISLDHDIASFKNGREFTGQSVCLYMCEKGINAKKIYLHTDNPVGRDNMRITLERAIEREFLNKNTKVYPYPIVSNKYT